MTKAVAIFSGLPACGKSTFRNNLLAERAKYAQEALPLWSAHSSDDIIDRVAQTSGKTYTEVFELSIKRAEQQYFDQIRQAIKFGDQLIIADRTHVSKVARKRVMDVVRKCSSEYEFWSFSFTCRTAEWDARLRGRPDKRIPEIVLNRMLKAWEQPSKEEGFVRIENINTSGPVIMKEWYEKVEFML